MTIAVPMKSSFKNFWNLNLIDVNFRSLGSNILLEVLEYDLYSWNTTEILKHDRGPDSILIALESREGEVLTFG